MCIFRCPTCKKMYPVVELMKVKKKQCNKCRNVVVITKDSFERLFLVPFFNIMMAIRMLMGKDEREFFYFILVLSVILVIFTTKYDSVKSKD